MDDLLIFIAVVSIFFLCLYLINNKILDKDVIRVKSTVDDMYILFVIIQFSSSK